MQPLRNLAAMALVLLAGCSRSNDASSPDVVAVSGMLSYHGEPVADAQLTFWGDDELEPAFALTDRQGKFRCLSNDSEGIAPGEYLVTVSRPGGGIPGKYGDAESSPLRVDIPPDETTLTLELED